MKKLKYCAECGLGIKGGNFLYCSNYCVRKAAGDRRFIKKVNAEIIKRKAALGLKFDRDSKRWTLNVIRGIEGGLGGRWGLTDQLRRSESDAEIDAIDLGGISKHLNRLAGLTGSNIGMFQLYMSRYRQVHQEKMNQPLFPNGFRKQPARKPATVGRVCVRCEKTWQAFSHPLAHDSSICPECRLKSPETISDQNACALRPFGGARAISGSRPLAMPSYFAELPARAVQTKANKPILRAWWGAKAIVAKFLGKR